MVNLFLYGPCGNQSVDGDLFLLANPPGPLSGLGVSAGVPVRVYNHHPVSTGQVHPQATHTGGQQEDKQLWSLTTDARNELLFTHCT